MSRRYIPEEDEEESIDLSFWRRHRPVFLSAFLLSFVAVFAVTWATTPPPAGPSRALATVVAPEKAAGKVYLFLGVDDREGETSRSDTVIVVDFRPAMKSQVPGTKDEEKIRCCP